jgi:chromosome segregation ATPase
MSSKYKSKTEEFAVADALSIANQEIADLADEMRTWADNLEGGNLGHTDKAQRVAEAADSLEGIEQQEDLHEEAESARCTVTIQVVRSARYSPSRAVRAANAAAMLQAAAGAIQDRISELEELKREHELKHEEPQEGATADGPEAEACADEIARIEDAISELESQADSIEQAASELEGIEFPGMFG